MLVLLWRSVAGLMWLAFAVAGVAAGGLIGSLIGLIVALIYEQFAGILEYPASMQMGFFGIYIGFMAGGAMGLYGATRIWLKTLHPVMGSEGAEVQEATATV